MVAELVSMLRAGVANGITTQSPSSAHGLVSVLTLHPFCGNDETIVALRDGRPGGGADAVEWAAALLVHELGHQLMHLGHPTNAACVHATAADLELRPVGGTAHRCVLALARRAYDTRRGQVSGIQS